MKAKPSKLFLPCRYCHLFRRIVFINKTNLGAMVRFDCGHQDYYPTPTTPEERAKPAHIEWTVRMYV